MLTELTDVMRDVEFKVFSSVANAAGGRVAALRVPGGGTLTRGEIDGYGQFVGIYGAKGLAYIKVNEVAKGREGLQSPIVKNLSDAALKAIVERTGACDGDLIFFGADKAKVVNDALGALRAKIGHEKGFAGGGLETACGCSTFRCSSGTRKRSAGTRCTTRSPHPWTATRTISTAIPGKALSKAYDMVLNGWEIGGGSVRIHRQDVQSKVFSALNIEPEEARDEVRVLARRPAVRRAASRRPCLRPGPHRDADGRRAVDPRRDRVSEDPARPGPAHAGAQRGGREAAARAAHPRAYDRPAKA